MHFVFFRSPHINKPNAWERCWERAWERRHPACLFDSRSFLVTENEHHQQQAGCLRSQNDKLLLSNDCELN